MTTRTVSYTHLQGLQDRYLYDYTFANDNGQNPLMDKAHAYVENWKEAYKNNTGLLLFGDVGTGKSFFAGCIANALLDRDVPVLMTNFPTILNRLTGMFSEDRADFIATERNRLRCRICQNRFDFSKCKNDYRPIWNKTLTRTLIIIGTPICRNTRCCSWNFKH